MFRLCDARPGTLGGAPKIEAGYVDRSSYRDIIGSRLARETILEPKKMSQDKSSPVKGRGFFHWRPNRC